MKKCDSVCHYTYRKDRPALKNSTRLREGTIMAKRRKNYYPPMRVGMYVTNMFNAENQLRINMTAVTEELDRRLQSGAISAYAWIIHDSDKVDLDTVNQRNEARKEMFIRRVYELREETLVKEDLQSFVFNDLLKSDCAEAAMAYVNERLPEYVVNDPKAVHVHIVVIMARGKERRVNEVANWFNGMGPTEPAYWQLFKDNPGQRGSGARNALEYLVHQNHPHKHPYDPTKVVASFDYAAELQRIMEDEIRHEQMQISRDELRDCLNDITAGRMTLAKFREKHTDAVYIENATKLKMAEEERMKRFAVMPEHRISAYFGASKDLSNSGNVGGIGKSSIAKEFAALLAIHEYGAPADIDFFKESNPYVFFAGDPKVPLDSYAQQPIVIYDDYDGDDMKKAFIGRKGIKNFLDPRPNLAAQNRKGSQVVCTAKYVFITGNSCFDDFIESMYLVNGKSKTNDTKDQYLRRFNFFVELSSSSCARLYKNRAFHPISGIRNRFYSEDMIRVGVSRIWDPDTIIPDDARHLAMQRMVIPMLRDLGLLNLDDVDVPLDGIPDTHMHQLLRELGQITYRHNEYCNLAAEFDDRCYAVMSSEYRHLPEIENDDDGTMLPFPENEENAGA